MNGKHFSITIQEKDGSGNPLGSPFTGDFAEFEPGGPEPGPGGDSVTCSFAVPPTSLQPGRSSQRLTTPGLKCPTARGSSLPPGVSIVSACVVGESVLEVQFDNTTGQTVDVPAQTIDVVSTLPKC